MGKLSPLSPCHDATDYTNNQLGVFAPQIFDVCNIVVVGINPNFVCIWHIKVAYYFAISLTVNV